MLIVALLACTPAEPQSETRGVPALGAGSHDLSAVSMERIADSAQGLNQPRDLSFNPERPGELWIVNQGDDSTTVIFDAGGNDQGYRHDIDPYAEHFMEEVSSIDFGAPGTFATCQESRNTYNDQARHNDFMGPTLWSSDFGIYARSNPEAVQYVGFDLGSHLDMLHESPLCTGITWDHDNVYWVFDGLNESIARYDFAEDHGPGYDDHSDGIIAKYVMGEVSYLPGVSSHLALDADSGLLYVSDSGNNRVAVLDTQTGQRGQDLPLMEPGVQHYQMDGAELWTLIDGAEFGLGAPSGLALVDDLLYVTDHGTGNIFAFTLDGELVDWLGTGRTGMMGLVVVDDHELWFVDTDTDELYRILAP